MDDDGYKHKFEIELRKFDPEFGLFCIMKLEADYGNPSYLSWRGVKSALHTGVVMGWLSAAGEKKYHEYMEELFLQKVKAQMGEDSEATKKEAVYTLLNRLSIRPRFVMATLSKLGIVDVHPHWKAFVTQDLHHKVLHSVDTKAPRPAPAM